jgi:hypothetical protein
MGKKSTAYRSLVVKPKRKRPLGRSKHRCVDSIKIDLTEISWGNVEWIGLAQDMKKWRILVNAVMNFRVP